LGFSIVTTVSRYSCFEIASSLADGSRLMVFCGTKEGCDEIGDPVDDSLVRDDHLVDYSLE
jgi:hypothetical protein